MAASERDDLRLKHAVNGMLFIVQDDGQEQHFKLGSPKRRNDTPEGSIITPLYSSITEIKSYMLRDYSFTTIWYSDRSCRIFNIKRTLKES